MVISRKLHVLTPMMLKYRSLSPSWRNLIATLRGDLVVKTTPEEATVSIGRKKPQISPASYQDLDLGTYMVAVSKQGYKPIKKEILIKKGENVLGPLPLERIKGALSINTEPQGAKYILSQVKSEASSDKKFEPRRGQAPALEPDLPTGGYLIKIERLGWMDEQINVSVRGVQEGEVNLRFAKLDETLNLQDPETFGKILENAQDIKELRIGGEQKDELVYNPKSGTPCTGWIKKMYHRGQVRSLFSVKEGKKDGFWTSWHENGQKWVEMNYKEGNLHGSEIHWRENGQKISETNYKEGKLHGPQIHWRENGQKRSETHYANGQKHGSEIHWREDGNKELETEYRDGKQHGLTTEWHMNGQKKRESNFEDNELDGISISWDKDGRQKYRIEYKDGKRHGLTTEWHSNGQKSSENNWRNGKPHGLSTSWDDKGQKRSETRYQDGQIVR